MASELDILTLEEALAALKLTGSSNTILVGAMVTGISGAVDRWCGPVVGREVTETFTGSTDNLVLRHTPVLSIDTVTEDDDELDEDDFHLETNDDSHLAILHRLSGGTSTCWSTSTDWNVTVAYTAGRYASTEEVDDYWKAGVISILIMQWSWESPQWARNPQGDEFAPDGPFDIQAAVSARFKGDLDLPMFAS